MAILTCNSHRSPGASRRCRLRYDLSAFLCALLVLAVGWIAGTSDSTAAEILHPEYQVKAAHLVNLPKYVDWPAEAFAGTNSPIVIAVLGESAVTAEIQKVIAGRTVNGRNIVLKRLASGEESEVCHILFVPAVEQRRSPNLLAKLKDTPVLTVGEKDDFLEHGGILNLALRNQEIVLEVNLVAAGNARINISSKLLGVAKVVKDKTK